MTGRMYDERLGKMHFWMTFIFFNATFGADARDRARRGCRAAWPTTPSSSRAGTCSSRSPASSLGLSTLVFVYNMVASWRGGPRAAANPWRALTLEWQVSSPPPIFNFDAIPTVVGGPYEYGVPGAVHGDLQEAAAEVAPAPAGTVATAPKEE